MKPTRARRTTRRKRPTAKRASPFKAIVAALDRLSATVETNSIRIAALQAQVDYLAAKIRS
jgi:hypothetical protein